MNACASRITDRAAPSPSHADSAPPIDPTSDTEKLTAGYRFALSLVGNKHDAEDLVQQAWLRLTRSYGEVQNRSVLFRTIRNLLIDQKRRSRIVSFQPLDTDYQAPISVEQGAISDMESILQTLKPEERQCLYLQVVEGYRTDDISKITGMPRGTILSHIYRGRKRLAKSIGSEFRTA